MVKKAKIQLSTSKKPGFDWEAFLSGASGAIKKAPKSKLELIAVGTTTTLDYIAAAIKGQLKEKFAWDVSRLIEAGKLDKGFLNDDLTRKTFTEIADIIDKESPTEDKVDAMVALLTVVADKDETHRYEASIHLSTLRQIDSVELNVLMTCYQIRKEVPDFAKGVGNKDTWRKKIIEYMKWDENMAYQIEMRESRMEELRLIDSSPGQDRNNMGASANFRLTGLGIKLGDILTSKR